MPQHAGESYFRKLLEWNLFGRETGGASLAYDPETQDVLLCRLIDIDSLTAERFDATVQDVVKAAGGLMTKLKGDLAAELRRSKTDGDGHRSTCGLGARRAILRRSATHRIKTQPRAPPGTMP